MQKLTLPPELQDPKPRTAVGGPCARFSAGCVARRWHRVLGFTVVNFVLLPVVVVALYLWGIAHDQYASTTGFSIRSEESSTTLDILGGLTDLSGTSSRDSDIIYDYLHSQTMLENMQNRLDLGALWTHPGDPVYTLPANASVETMLRYWRRMVRVHYDSASGLIQVQALAFDPTQAQALSQAILDETRATVARLNAGAQQDMIGFALADLKAAHNRLRTARDALNAFRQTHQIVDPKADFEGKLGVLNSLLAQQADAMVELDMLRSIRTRNNDMRVAAAGRRLQVITNLIETERNKVRSNQDGAAGYADLYEAYQQIAVDLEFAEQAYVAAQAGYDHAVADARRTTRFVSAHIAPTRAQTSQYPRKGLTLFLIFAGLGLCWVIVVLMYYAVRDRR